MPGQVHSRHYDGTFPEVNTENGICPDAMLAFAQLPEDRKREALNQLREAIASRGGS